MYFKGFDDVVTIRTYKYEYYIQKRCYKLRKLGNQEGYCFEKTQQAMETRVSFSSIVKRFDILTHIT